MDEVRRAYDKVQTGKNDMVEELEKIKSDFDEIDLNFLDNSEVRFGISMCRNELDNHIKELKGENNGNS